MKIEETRFEDYIKSAETNNIFPELETYFAKFPKNISDLKHIIFYGPIGNGKYTQSLMFLKKYSDSNMKYEKKIIIDFENKKKEQYKVSDIHYEIDMELFACNARNEWNSFFFHVLDIINAKPKKHGFILCKNFHKIDNELLEIFNNYMNDCFYGSEIILRFILITEHMSFIPREILNKTKIIPIQTKQTIYPNIFKKNSKNNSKKNNTNLKNYKKNIKINYEKCLINQVIQNINNAINDYKQLDFMELRENIYKIFIYQQDIFFFLFQLLKCNVQKKNNPCRKYM